jgi:hypothetical protein
MRLTARQENARTLAALMGMGEEEAAQRLKLRIAVTFDAAQNAADELARHVLAMLNRTVAWAGPPVDGAYAAEIVIGAAAARTSAPTVWAGQLGEDFIVTTGLRLPVGPLRSTPPALLVIAACYVAAAAVRVAIGADFPVQSAEPVVIRWRELIGQDPAILRGLFDVRETYLAGAGAVGNGFLYTLQQCDVAGTLYVVDPKRANAGGLNRCLLLAESDIGEPKASRLCKSIQGSFPHLRLVPKEMTLSEARRERGRDFLIERLVIGVDSRAARRSLQSEMPKAVFDASTTDIREVVLHFNRQPTELACLGCIYPENAQERKHEENVAAALGITVAEVRAVLCTRETAEKICRRYPDARADDLIGRAFDTVYKEFCGLGKLKAEGGQQVLAPFSFVSVLAGAQLAVEFLLRTAGHETGRFNYWRQSPWHSPNLALRQRRPCDPSCEFCGNPVIRRELARMFGG